MVELVRQWTAADSTREQCRFASLWRHYGTTTSFPTKFLLMKSVWAL